MSPAGAGHAPPETAQRGLGGSGQTATGSDPLQEAPDAVWYVRPPSGGQFGPARGETMHRWIAEGRVTADSMVWRDGWEDWREAGPLFPQLPTPPEGAVTGGQGSESPLPEFSIQDAASAPRRARARRRRSPVLAIAAVVTLVLVSLALLVTLVWVLSNQG